MLYPVQDAATTTSDQIKIDPATGQALPTDASVHTKGGWQASVIRGWPLTVRQVFYRLVGAYG